MKQNLHNKNLSKMLGRYGASTLAAAAVCSVAGGQIVYTPEVNDTIHLGDTLQLDFNADDISDVEFTIALNPRHITKTWGDFIFTKAIAAPGNKGIGEYWYWNSYINPLEADQMISAGVSLEFMNQAKKNERMDTAYMASNMGTMSHMGWTTWGIYGWGITGPDTTTYLGYEFRIDEEPYYGWVKVTFHRATQYTTKGDYYGDRLYLVINEYAYETTLDYIEAGATVSIGVENQKSEAFSLYPNPAIDQVTVRMKENSLYDVKVYDLTGRNIMNRSFEGMEYNMDISELNSGMYMLVITDGKVKLTQELVVK